MKKKKNNKNHSPIRGRKSGKNRSGISKIYNYHRYESRYNIEWKKRKSNEKR